MSQACPICEANGQHSLESWRQYHSSPPRRNKYGTSKPEQRRAGGKLFDSAKEATVYRKLLCLQEHGEVSFMVLQPRFLLQEGFEKNGVKYRPIYYVADFDVTWKDGRREVVDAKGYKTPVYLLKKKLFEKRYPDLTISEW